MIETILVITLLAAAAVAGGFILDGQWLSRRNATDATNEVCESLRAARNTAIINRTDVHIRHDNVKGREMLSIVEEAGPMRDGKKWQVDLGTQTVIFGSPTEIWFKSTGQADRDLSWKITDGNTAGLVSVTPVDGNVSSSLP